MKAFAGSDTELSLAVVKFLIEQDLIAEAVSVFNSIDKEAKARSPQSRELIDHAHASGTIQSCKGDLARADGRVQSRRRLESMSRCGGNALVWNGGFETDAVEGLNHFDWAIRENKYARIVIDRNFARTGSRSLKVVFLGIDTTSLRDQVQQTIILRSRRQLSPRMLREGEGSGYAGRTADRSYRAGRRDRLSEPVKADSSDWQRLVVDFVGCPRIRLRRLWRS